MRFTVVIYRVAFFNISRNRLPEQAHQKHTSAFYAGHLLSILMVEVRLWWTWRDSNPRLACLFSKGITTILYHIAALESTVAQLFMAGPK